MSALLALVVAVLGSITGTNAFVLYNDLPSYHHHRHLSRHGSVHNNNNHLVVVTPSCTAIHDSTSSLSSRSTVSSLSMSMSNLDHPSSSSSSSYSFLATCVPGMAHILEQELNDLASSPPSAQSNIPNMIWNIRSSGNAAVTFDATREGSLIALCWLRTAHRILELVADSTTAATAVSSTSAIDGNDYNDDDENESFKDQIYYDENNRRIRNRRGAPPSKQHTKRSERRSQRSSSSQNSKVLLHTRDDIHDFIRNNVDIKQLLGDGHGELLSLSVKAILNNPRDIPKDLSHSHYTALTVKNALCDVVRDLRGDRPDVDLDNPDVPLVVILRGEQDQFSRFDAPEGSRHGAGAASIALYRSLHPPGSLHKRGYRRGSAIHKAAMKESMAAGLLIEAGWNDKVHQIKQSRGSVQLEKQHQQQGPKVLQMIDPMCGSGSFCIEAAMIAADIAPGLMRIRCGLSEYSRPPVTRWKSSASSTSPSSSASSSASKSASKSNNSNNHEAVDYDDDNDDDETSDVISSFDLWKKILADATQRAKSGIQFLRKEPQLIKIWGNDIHEGAISITESSLINAGLQSFVKLTNEDCYDLDLATITSTAATVEGSDANDDDDYDYGNGDRQVFVVTNPPWGVRLTDDIADSWEGLRYFIRDRCPDKTEVWILSGDKRATSTLKLKRDRMIPIQTGDQHLRWIRYTIRSFKDKEVMNDRSSTSTKATAPLR